MKKLLIGVLFAFSTFLVGMPVAQADYPDKPVTFVVPWVSKVTFSNNASVVSIIQK